MTAKRYLAPLINNEKFDISIKIEITIMNDSKEQMVALLSILLYLYTMAIVRRFLLELCIAPRQDMDLMLLRMAFDSHGLR